ncbi:MAG: tetratricopeptide repeat protein [Rhodospirillaceae bacterium]|nr:tetratricopeptide repeat protein [Rhodospirillaceae bacterium]
MHEDRWGNPVTASTRAAVDGYDDALAAFLEYRLAAGEYVKAALAADPSFPMGLCLRGYMLMQLATNAVAGKVDQAIAAAQGVAGDATPRERMHLEALQQWRVGQIGAACRQWEDIVAAFPRDLLALRLHHFMSFWQGRRVDLREVPATALKAIDPEMPGYGFVLGMHAFGLEECGHYRQAEQQGREAVARNRDDLWAIHAVAHVLEMQGRADEGLGWLDYPAGSWADRNPFKAHVWWHAALFALERGDPAHVLELYDRDIRVDESGFYLDVQNAASLLMRLTLAGIDVGDRWQPLADLAQTRTGDHVMAFTDAHYMMALAGAGRIEAAGRYLDSLRAFAATGANDAATLAATLTVPIGEALLAYGEGQYGQAGDKFAALVGAMAPIGGSHAQQDIFSLILIDAVIRAGRKDQAQALLDERVRHRPADFGTRKLMEALAR